MAGISSAWQMFTKPATRTSWALVGAPLITPWWPSAPAAKVNLQPSSGSRIRQEAEAEAAAAVKDGKTERDALIKKVKKSTAASRVARLLAEPWPREGLFRVGHGMWAVKHSLNPQ